MAAVLYPCCLARPAIVRRSGTAQLQQMALLWDEWNAEQIEPLWQ